MQRCMQKLRDPARTQEASASKPLPYIAQVRLLLGRVKQSAAETPAGRQSGRLEQSAAEAPAGRQSDRLFWGCLVEVWPAPAAREGRRAERASAAPGTGGIRPGDGRVAGKHTTTNTQEGGRSAQAQLQGRAARGKAGGAGKPSSRGGRHTLTHTHTHTDTHTRAHRLPEYRLGVVPASAPW